MASNDQSYKVGELKGQAEVKAGQIGDAIKGQAEGAKDKASELAGAAQKRAGEAKDETGKAAQAAKDKASETAKPAGQDNSAGGMVQKAGQQLKDTAQGAVDAVKNTFGMADDGVKK